MSELKFCSYRMCKYGRRTKYNSWLIRYLRRCYRHKVKLLIKQGRFEELPESISIVYTD